MKTHITVNLKDGSEFDVDASVVDFSDLRAALNDVMFDKRVTPDQWSSVVVTVVNEATKAEEPHRFPDRLTLRDTKVTADGGQRIYSTATGYGYEKCEYVRADVVAAAPGLLGALRDLIGLIQLVRNRDDLTTEVREALTYGHRIDAAFAAIAKAEGR